MKVSKLDSPVQIAQKDDAVNEMGKCDIPNKAGSSGLLEYPSHQKISMYNPKTITSCNLDSKFLDVANNSTSDSDSEEEEPPTCHCARDRAHPQAKTLSPLKRHLEKRNENKNQQECNVAMLRDELQIINEKLSKAKSASTGGGNVCGNCHLRLGHTAKKCAIEKCVDVFDCGLEKFHPGQINHNKMRQEIHKEEAKLQS